MIDILGWIEDESGLAMTGNSRLESIVVAAHLDTYVYADAQVLDKGDEVIVVLVSFLVSVY